MPSSTSVENTSNTPSSTSSRLRSRFVLHENRSECIIYSQDGQAVIQIVEHVLEQLRKMDVKEVNVRSDNAGQSEV